LTWHQRSEKLETPMAVFTLSSSSSDSAAAAYDSSQVSAGKSSRTVSDSEDHSSTTGNAAASISFRKNARTVDILTMREKHVQLGIFIPSVVARKVTSEKSVVLRTKPHIQVRAYQQVRFCVAYLLTCRSASRRPLLAS